MNISFQARLTLDIRQRSRGLLASITETANTASWKIAPSRNHVFEEFEDSGPGSSASLDFASINSNASQPLSPIVTNPLGTPKKLSKVPKKLPSVPRELPSVLKKLLRTPKKPLPLPPLKAATDARPNQRPPRTRD